MCIRDRSLRRRRRRRAGGAAALVVSAGLPCREPAVPVVAADAAVGSVSGLLLAGRVAGVGEVVFVAMQMGAWTPDARRGRRA
eukprot:5858523-Lingulodinium_polyedra.AAC.1